MAEPVGNNLVIFSHQCGNDRLIGEVGDKVGLLLGEALDLLPKDRDRAN